MKKYRVIKEFFVDAHDEYEAETKAEDNKIKLSCNLIDVHEIDEDSEKQWVECLKCDKQFEQTKNDTVCIYCNNQDREKTIYIYPEMIKAQANK